MEKCQVHRRWQSRALTGDALGATCWEQLGQRCEPAALSERVNRHAAPGPTGDSASLAKDWRRHQLLIIHTRQIGPVMHTLASERGVEMTPSRPTPDVKENVDKESSQTGPFIKMSLNWILTVLLAFLDLVYHSRAKRYGKEWIIMIIMDKCKQYW